MKKILLLGGFGFLGTNVMKYVDNHLCDAYRFIVFDKYDHHMGGVEFHCIDKVYAGDFADKSLMEQIFQENDIDIILHSLSTTVPVDSATATYDVESNLLPTLHVLDMMVKYCVHDIVYISSGGAIYGTRNAEIHNESEAVYPISSYGVVKLATEKYIMQYSQLYGIQSLILRLSNPYGPYHYSMKQGVINVALAKALHGEVLDIWGDGNGKKDYIYVEDYVRILFALLEKNVHNEVINVASGQLLSVNDISSFIQQIIPSFEVHHTEAQKFDASRFELDTTKLMQLMPDFQFTSFNQGLHDTHKWSKQNL